MHTPIAEASISDLSAVGETCPSSTQSTNTYVMLDYILLVLQIRVVR